MPLIKITDVVQAPHDGDDPVWGSYLDMPQRDTLFDGSIVDAWGWVLGRKRRVKFVEFLHDGRRLRRVPANVVRPDVARTFPDIAHAERSGFRTEIPIVGRHSEFQIDVVAIMSDGTRSRLGLVVAGRRWRDTYGPNEGPPLVSIVIPCFNQAQYLGEAIESARFQAYPHVEIVVVDDGSHDNTGEVARRYPGVRCVRQDNQGLSAARNTGIRHTNGMYLIFLDADDRLTPDAVDAGLRMLAAHPEAALTFGRCRWIGVDGSALPTPARSSLQGDQFINLLRSNCVGMHATVMYRRGVFEIVRGFDTTLDAAEDYDLALRIARQFPVCWSDQVVAEYRIRGSSMSRNPALMLDAVLRVLRAQRPYVGGSAAERTAYRAGVRFWKDYYGRPLAHQVAGHAHRREWRRFLRGIWILARQYPPGLASVVLGSTTLG